MVTVAVVLVVMHVRARCRGRWWEVVVVVVVTAAVVIIVRRYVLLEKPIQSSNDLAYIEQVVTKLMKVHFPKEVSKCFVY